MIDKLRKLKAVATGRDFFYKTTVKVESEKLGNKTEGWWIYPKLITNKQATVLSFGLGEDISFDMTVMQKYDAKVYGFDPTPKSLKYVKSIDTGDNFTLLEYAIANQDGQLTFNLPRNEDHVSGSFVDIDSTNTITVQAKKLQTILDELKIVDIDILKMDIEGAEYDVIEDMIDSKIFPNQVLIEYHHFFDSISNKKTKDNIRLLIDNGYELFCIEAYNYSFVKKELI